MTAVVISGLVVGLLYALAGLGLVVVYRTSQVLNFAMGGVGAVVAYAASDLLDAGLPYPLVLLLGLVVGAATGAALELGVARPLRRRPHLTIALGTLGALLVIEGLLGLRYGYTPQNLPRAFSGPALSAGPVSLSANQSFIVVVAVAATALLFGLVMRTRLGVSMRAVSSGPTTSALLGVEVGRVRLLAWVLGGVYGGLAALLVTPLTYLSPNSFTVFLLTAFAAVVLGGFTSILGVVVGALVFGVATNLLLSYLDSGLISTYTFVGIALVLVLRPHGLFGRREREVPEPTLPGGGPTNAVAARVASAAGSLRRSVPRLPASATDRRTRSAGVVVLVVALAAVPLLADDRTTFLLATVLATFVGVVGLNVLVGFSGQVSLGHSAFLGIGAYTAAISVERGLPVLLGVLLAVLAGALAGVLLGLPATRLSGIYLVLLTLIFAFAVPELLLYLKDLTGGASGLPLPPPEALFDPRAMYWFLLVVAAAAGALVAWLGRSRVGRAWRAVRDSEDGARSLGLRPSLVKLGAFALSSALAALGGALGGLLIGFISPDSYGVFVSIYALLAVVLGGQGSVIGSLLGATFITVVPDLTAGSGVPQDLTFGLALLLVLYLAPQGLAGLLAPRRTSSAGDEPRETQEPDEADGAGGGRADERPARAGTSGSAGPSASVGDGPAPAPGPAGEVVLALEGVSAGYGVEPVLHEVDLTVGAGEVVALLGANGAGKSTVLRVVSGLVPLDAGRLTWEGRGLSDGRHGPTSAARLGLGHVPEGRGIFPDLTVRENLVTGTFASAQARLDDDTLEEVLGRFPALRDRLAQTAGTLSGGEQQMLAVGRALVARPRLLMLDEPSLGLSPLISQKVFEILGEIARSGVSILLVEQNARASLALADRAYVLSRGRVVMAGTADDVAADPSLTSSYLEAHDA